MHDTPYGYCRCGCGKKTRPAPRTRTAQGWKKGEPMPYLACHSSRHKPKPPRYHAEDRGHETPCWVWDGPLGGGGYGAVRNPETRKRMQSHRYFYEQAKGPIPEGLQLDHLCRVRSCCNPDHLEAVTCAENLRRGEKAKLIPAQVAAIRQRKAAGERTADLATEYGVSGVHIWCIATGKTWGEPGIRSKAA